MARFSERSLIETILYPLSKDCPGAFGLSDDAALISPRSGFEMVVTKDALVAGVHFFPGDAPELIAAKALRVNLSDLYAKGAEPAYYLLSLFLTPDMNEAWLRAFAKGLAADQKKYAIGLLGGDTVRTPGPFSLSVTMLGEVPKGKMVHRSGARAGDHIFVSGPIGDAALGLEVAAKQLLTNDSNDSDYLKQQYLLPDPDQTLILPVRDFASAAMDVSDGLAGDLTLLCAASGVTAQVDVAAVPLSTAARHVLQNRPELISKILTGGDDYKILCTVPSENVAEFNAICGDKMHRIGEIITGHSSVKFIGRDGQTMSLSALSYRHF